MEAGERSPCATPHAMYYITQKLPTTFFYFLSTWHTPKYPPNFFFFKFVVLPEPTFPLHPRIKESKRDMIKMDNDKREAWSRGAHTWVCICTVYVYNDRRVFQETNELSSFTSRGLCGPRSGGVTSVATCWAPGPGPALITSSTRVERMLFV